MPIITQISIDPSTREQDYQVPSLSVGPFDIPWPMFEGNGDDLEVLVNGVIVPRQGNWVFTGTPPEPSFPGQVNTWTNNQVTFLVAIIGSLKVIARRVPRRQQGRQFAEGAGVSSRVLNSALNEIVAQLQEQRRDIDDFDVQGVQVALAQVTAAIAQAQATNAVQNLPSGTNLNTVVSLGKYAVLNATNAPAGVSGRVLMDIITDPADVDGVSQSLYVMESGVSAQSWLRRRDLLGVWSAWKLISLPDGAATGATSFSTVAEMQAAAIPAGASGTYGLLGIGSPQDGGEGFFRWDLASVALPNGRDIVIPSSITHPAPGRYIRVADMSYKETTIEGVGDGATDDTVAIATAIARLRAGGTLNMQGKKWRFDANTYQNLDLPEYTKIRNGEFVITGVNTGQMFFVRGTTSALTYTGGSIAKGDSQVTNLAGLTGADLGKMLFVTGTNLIAAGYTAGQYVKVAAVSGTTVTFEGAVSMPFSGTVTFVKVNTKRGIRFENVKVSGDPTKVQRAIGTEYLEASHFDVEGENVGHYTLALRRAVNVTFDLRGSNWGINTDNGSDYLGVIYDGCIGVEGKAVGSCYRHVIAGGNPGGVDLNCSVSVIGFWMKDSCLDWHPGCMNLTAVVKVMSIRSGGTFSNQPVGLMYQGGGLLKVDVEVDGFDTSAATIQLLQNTEDSIDARLNALGANGSATRGLDVQVQKTGGVVRAITAFASVPDLQNAASIGIDVDTSGSASGVTINSVTLDGPTSGKSAGKRVLARATHTINYIKVSGIGYGQATGGYGVYVEAVGTITQLMANDNSINGAAGTLGIRAVGVGRSFANGNMVVGVGGGAITTNAIVGFTTQSGNDYT
jgi:hypothetical protein